MNTFTKYYYGRKEKGLCTKCGIDLGGIKKTLCNDCIEKRLQYRTNKKAFGICERCDRKVFNNCVFCEYHLEKGRYNSKKRKERKKQTGICLYCSKKAEDNKTMCNKHLNICTQQAKEKRKKIIRLCGQCQEVELKKNHKFCYECALLRKTLSDQKNRRKYTRNKKILVFNHYGKVCQCCGESRLTMLAIDHIDGNGAEHRRSINMRCGGYSFYCWLEKQGFPDGYQVLCHNCNFSKYFLGGTCEHKQNHTNPSDIFCF